MRLTDVSAVGTALATDGYAVLDGLFSRRECADIAMRLAAVPLSYDLGDAGAPMVYRPMAHAFDDRLRDYACDRRWRPLVSATVGDDVCLLYDQGVTKTAGCPTALPEHQDDGYTPLTGDPYLTCWVALDDTDTAGGSLFVVPGSHRGGPAPHEPHRDEARFLVAQPTPGSASDPPPGTPPTSVDVAAGDVVAMTSLTRHGSWPNRTDRDRPAWVLQYCAPDVRLRTSGDAVADRLRLTEGGEWLDAPYRPQRLDLAAVIERHDEPPRHGTGAPP